MSYKQIIIARKDLNMSPGELAAQVSHASLAFLANKLYSTEGLWELTYRARGYRSDSTDPKYCPPEGKTENHRWGWRLAFLLDEGTYADWLCGSATKIVCEARCKSHLLKVLKKAKELGLEENKDYFLIRDNCSMISEELSEKDALQPLTCIGFRPLPEELADQISGMYHLYV